MSITMSPEASELLKKIEAHLDSRISAAITELKDDITRMLPEVLDIRDPQAAIVDLLPTLKAVELRQAEEGKRLANWRMASIDVRTERLRSLPLAIKDWTLMKEREAQLLTGQKPVQAERSNFKSHADVRKHYHAGIKKLNADLAAFGSLRKEAWGVALRGKWFDTAVKYRDLFDEREREAVLGMYKGWRTTEYDYDDDSEDEKDN